MKVKNDRCSKFSNLNSWKEAWKNQSFNRIQTHDLRDTSVMLNQLSYEATHWERALPTELHSSVGRACTGIVEVTGSNPIESLIFFSGFFFPAA